MLFSNLLTQVTTKDSKGKKEEVRINIHCYILRDPFILKFPSLPSSRLYHFPRDGFDLPILIHPDHSESFFG